MKKHICLLLLTVIFEAYSSELILSANGYSGVGIIPSTTVIPAGKTIFSFDSNLPGAKNSKGYNEQIGLGIYQDFELVGRLATQDLRCNMFAKGQCPANTIRDFSASIKWSPQFEWLKNNQSNLVVGMTDIGGSASYFKSYYVAASKNFGYFDFMVGKAKSIGEYSVLGGNFFAGKFSPKKWIDLSLQKIENHNLISATFSSDIPNSNLSGYLSFNHRINNSADPVKNWIGVGVAIPLSNTSNSDKNYASKYTKISNGSTALVRLSQDKLKEILESKGFFNPTIDYSNNILHVSLENTAYAWNATDALGVAMSVIASTHGWDNPQSFELNILSRGISQLVVSGEASCLRAWLEQGDICDSLEIRSGLQRNTDYLQVGDFSFKFDLNSWYFRPEIILGPALASAIGTEFGAFDMDLGVNVNALLPLWPGATLETNRLEPVGVGTRGFEAGGAFYASRIRPSTTRTLFHQIFNLSKLNTQARYSYGNAYTNWRGQQIETSTQSDNGRHRIGWISGEFKNISTQINQQKNYGLATYRYAYDDSMTTVTEISSGKFWAGDRGWILGQKFWHGDTALAVYLRRSRMTDASPLVSFAGFQISLPLTPRVNKGFENLAIKGVNQWTYALESRVFDRENLITGGFGEIPKVGESLIQTFNRDRNNTRYFEAGLIKAKSALNEIRAD